MEITDRVERLLALLLLAQMKATARREKVVQLNLAGFSNVEIADLLQTTPALVSQSLYEAKKTRPKKTRPSKSAAKKTRVRASAGKRT
jgi:predicted transcriptional regulator